MFSNHLVQFIAAIGLATSMLGCASDPARSIQYSDGIEIPFTSSEDGLIVVNVSVDGSEGLPFIVDTGASKSAITSEAVRMLNISVDETRQVTVRGLIDQSRRPQTNTVNLSVTEELSVDTELSVLPDRWNSAGRLGVLGMDLMEDLAVLIDYERQLLTVYPDASYARFLVDDWATIDLIEDPIEGTDFGLHFAEAHFDKDFIPALIDTGAEFSAMNWEAALTHNRLRRLRRRMEDEWRIDGAIGTFRPRALISVDYFAMGDFVWSSATFLALDLTPLSVIGGADQPLIVAGADLFVGRRFLIDFVADEMFIDPRSGPQDARAPKVSGKPSSEASLIKR